MENGGKSAPAGLDGLLIFVIAALVTSVARTNELLFSQGLALFTAGTWRALTTTGGTAYTPGSAPLLPLDIAGHTLAGAALWIPYFMTSRRVKAAFIH